MKLLRKLAVVALAFVIGLATLTVTSGCGGKEEGKEKPEQSGQ